MGVNRRHVLLSLSRSRGARAHTLSVFLSLCLLLSISGAAVEQGKNLLRLLRRLHVSFKGLACVRAGVFPSLSLFC
jgi:hypothetical protein